MRHTIRSSTVSLVALMALALAAAACGTTTPSGTPSTSPPPAPPASVGASTGPSPTAPAASATAAEACAISPQTGRLPSDRVIDLQVSSTADADVVTFVFGEPSLPGPAGAPEGTLETAEPPYTQASSGAPIEVIGEHVAHVRFAGMSLSNDIGEPVYQGELEVRPDLPALRHVVNMDQSEGVVGWYIGYDGPGCLTLRQDGQSVSVVIDRAGS